MNPGRRLAQPLLAALLALAVLALLLPALESGFVWDDSQYVVDNPQVAAGLTVRGVRWALTTFEAGNWHPLTWLSHMTDVELFGLQPRGHHLVNLLFHAVNAVLLFGLLHGLTGARWRSLFTAALFAVHPLHVESVAWISERKDVLAACLGLLTLGAYLRYARRGGLPRAAAVLLLFAFGLAAKPMLVTLPFVLLLLDAWPLGRLRPSTWRRPVLEKLPLLVLAACSSVVTYRAQASAEAIGVYPLDARLSNAIVAYARYLAKAAAPRELSAFYPHPDAALPAGQTIGALLALCLATGVVLANRRRRPWLAVGWLWFGGMLVPVIGLVQVGWQSSADRYTYLPLVGVFLMASWGVGSWAATRRRRTAAGAAAVIALVALSAASRVQLGFWRDPIALFTRAVSVSPRSWNAHLNLGFAYQERGRMAEAVDHYRMALALKPDCARALNNLGTIAAAQGRSEEALNYYRAALHVEPGFEEVLNNLGSELMNRDRLPEAKASFEQALATKPEYFDARVHLAELLLRQREWDEAAAQFRELLSLRPGSPRALNGLGVALASQGNYEAAIRAFREILRANPADADAAANLAQALSRLGR